MYAILVLQCGLSPDYVLDRMEFYERDYLLDNIWMKSKDNWEQARMVGFITAQTQSTKKLDMHSIMPFPWDEESKKEEISEEERQEILQEMKAMEEQMNRK